MKSTLAFPSFSVSMMAVEQVEGDKVFPYRKWALKVLFQYLKLWGVLPYNLLPPNEIKIYHYYRILLYIITTILALMNLRLNIAL